MWYRNSSDELLNLIREGESICNVRVAASFGNAYNDEERNTIGNISAVWLMKAIRHGVVLFMKKWPEHKDAAEAMLKFLDGKKEDVRIPDEKLSFAMRVNMVATCQTAIQRRYGFGEPRKLWQPNQVEWAGFDYDDYPKNENPDVVEPGREEPLQQIIGGFTEYIWYEMNESGGIDVFAKFEDVYDWDTEGGIQINLYSLGLTSPTFLKIVKKVTDRLNNVSFNENGPILRVEDAFWRHLQDLGYAQPYKHYYEGKLFSFPGDFFEAGKTPPEMIDEVGQLRIANARTYDMLKKVIENGFDSPNNYHASQLREILFKFIYVSGEKIDPSEIPELVGLLNVELREAYFPTEIGLKQDVPLLDFFFKAGIASVYDFINSYYPHPKISSYLVNNHWGEMALLSVNQLRKISKDLTIRFAEEKAKVDNLIEEKIKVDTLQIGGGSTTKENNEEGTSNVVDAPEE